MGTFRGISLNQSREYENLPKEKVVYSKIYKKKIDMEKLNRYVIRKWMKEEFEKALGTDDDIVFDNLMLMFEEPKNSKTPNGKEIQNFLEGFMEDNARKFLKTIWKSLLNAQQTSNGIPSTMLANTIKQIKQEQQKYTHPKSEKQIESLAIFRIKKEAGDPKAVYPKDQQPLVRPRPIRRQHHDHKRPPSPENRRPIKRMYKPMMRERPQHYEPRYRRERSPPTYHDRRHYEPHHDRRHYEPHYHHEQTRRRHPPPPPPRYPNVTHNMEIPPPPRVEKRRSVAAPPRRKVTYSTPRHATPPPSTTPPPSPSKYEP